MAKGCQVLDSSIDAGSVVHDHVGLAVDQAMYEYDWEQRGNPMQMVVGASRRNDDKSIHPRVEHASAQHLVGGVFVDVSDHEHFASELRSRLYCLEDRRKEVVGDVGHDQAQ